MHIRYGLWVVLLLALAAAAPAKERVWTSSDGRTMRAEFVRELNGEVTFLVGGKLQTIPLSRLSERDQQIVRDLAAGKSVPDDPLPPAADDPFTGPPAAATSPAGDESPAAAGEQVQPPAADRPPPLVSKPQAPVNRVWTDNQGRQTTGKFVRVFNGKVVLTRTGGPISVPFFDLSEADQQYVKDLLTSQGNEQLIPARPTASDAAEPQGDSPPTDQPQADPRQAGPPIGPPGTGQLGPGPRLGPGSSPPEVYSPDGHSPGGDPRESDSHGSGAGGYRPPTGSDLGGEPERQYDAQADYAASDPAPATRRVPVCSNCQARLTESQAQGTHCPFCRASWSFNQYADGGSSTSTSAASGTSQTSRGQSAWERLAPDTQRAVFGGIFVLVVLVVLAAIVIGLIAVVMSVASATRSGRQYRDF